jgi:hypothetical protein
MLAAGLIAFFGFSSLIVFGIFLAVDTGRESWNDFPGANGPRILAIAGSVVVGASTVLNIFFIMWGKGLITPILIVCGIMTVFACVVAITAFVYPLMILASVDEHWNDPTFDKPRLAVEGEFNCCGFAWYDSERTCGFWTSSNVDPNSCKAALAGSLETYANTIGFAAIGVAGSHIFAMLVVYRCRRFCLPSDLQDQPIGNESDFRKMS